MTQKQFTNVSSSKPRSTAASPNANHLLATSYNNLAWLLALKDDQGKEALVDIDNAIKLVGPLPDYLDTRGVIYLNLKKTQDAIKDLQSAVEADPSPPKLFHLAQAYLQANNRERGQVLLERCQWKEAGSAWSRRSPSSGAVCLPEGAWRIGNAVNWRQASFWRNRLFLANDGSEVVTVIVGDFGGKLLDLLRRDKSHAICDFLKTGDLQPLP